jgi:hypothetical protein
MEGASSAARPSVAEFFAKRSVLITGATGFVGKVRVRGLGGPDRSGADDRACVCVCVCVCFCAHV